MRALGMPGVDAEEVVDFLEAGDANKDGFLDYKEFTALVGGEGEEDEEEAASDDEGARVSAKTTPFGSDEVRRLTRPKPHLCEWTAIQVQA